MEGKNVRRYLFLGLFLILLALVARIFAPFLTIILWSGLLYAITAPLYERLTLSRGPRPLGEPWRSLIAAAFAVVAVVLIVVPIVFLGIAALGQLRDLTRTVAHLVESRPELLDLSPSGPVGKFVSDMTQGGIDLSGIDLRADFSHFLNGSSAKILGLSGLLVKNALLVVVGVLFVTFTLFFFLVDGPELLRTIINAVPIEREYSLLFLRTLRSTSRDLAVGYLLVSCFQGTVAFILFTAFGIKATLILGLLTVVASFIPMLGTSLVWGPVSLGVILSGDLQGGLVLLALSAVLIAGLDNVLRVILLRNRLKIHPLLIFFAIVGGLQVFGINGLVLGPLILMSFFTGARLYDRVTERELGDHGRSDVED